MAGKIKLSAQKSTVLEESRQTPKLDLSNATVKELFGAAKGRGCVAHDKISALPESDKSVSNRSITFWQSSAI